ncbi:hypothetical protein Q7C36_021761 [Tachysurus vachellii]|uniref:Uncharacterized protein n=1 Tax=Tachysurus vachellii TaxID=175792 RepID=A0AA88IPT2_TACVA|nr:hypothetical protein Q7C36_021761 [Tachysurus vachellii]
MKFLKSISIPFTISRAVEKRKLLHLYSGVRSRYFSEQGYSGILKQPSTKSPLLMHQRLRHEFVPSHPIISNGYQYSPLRFEELIAAPPLAMHLTFKSHLTLPYTLPTGVKPWIKRSPGLMSFPSEPCQESDISVSRSENGKMGNIQGNVPDSKVKAEKEALSFGCTGNCLKKDQLGPVQGIIFTNKKLQAIITAQELDCHQFSIQRLEDF